MLIWEEEEEEEEEMCWGQKMGFWMVIDFVDEFCSCC